MSIYPSEIEKKMEGLSWKWELAAFDVPVPSDLIKQEDGGQWSRYLDCLSPAQQLRKFGQALDQLHALLENVTDPQALTEKDQIAIYSKWQAASYANVAIQGRFQFAMDDSSRKFKSDIERGTFFITDFLKSVSSPDVKLWEDRQAKHNNINKAVFDSVHSTAIKVKRVVNNNPNGLQF
jgi:hypothetical protein